jgi:hypothetical protein
MVVAGNIQPRRLAGMAKDLVDDGLFQRFLTIHTRPSAIGIEDDIPLDPSAGSYYSDVLRTIKTLMPAKDAEGGYAPTYFDDEARAVRSNFTPLIQRLKIDPTLPIIIRETAPKWSGLLARLALIFHIVMLADRSLQGQTLEPRDLCRVTGPTVSMAATFLRRVALPNLFRLGYETMPEEGAPEAHARWIAGYILAHGSMQIRAREIGRAYRPLRGKPKDIEQVMGGMCDAGWTVPNSESRHDSACWGINPAVHAQFAVAAEAEKKRRASVMEMLRLKVADL